VRGDVLCLQVNNAAVSGMEHAQRVDTNEEQVGSRMIYILAGLRLPVKIQLVTKITELADRLQRRTSWL
jgi:hypothetical protein